MIWKATPPKTTPAAAADAVSFPKLDIETVPGILNVDVEGIDFGIEPLPSQSRSGYDASLPGAHAVGGRPIWTRPRAQQSGPNPAFRADNGADSDVIDGAVVVDEFVVDATPQVAVPSATDEEELELVDARAVPHDPPKTGWLWPWPTLFATLVVAAVVVVVVPLLVVSRRSTSYSVTSAPELQEAVILPYPPFRDDLNRETLNGIADTTSFYYLANAWMHNDPNLDSYTPERQLQRFNLVYMYFASNGANWTSNDHWLSYTVSECEWFNHNSSLSVEGWNPGMEPEPICDADGNLLVVNLTSNNLQGETISTWYGFGPKLKVVDLSNNGLHGQVRSITTQQSPDIQVYILSNNQLTGMVTGQGGFSAFNVRIVKLDGNQLLGYAPAVYMLLQSLEVMNLTGNLYDRNIATYLEYCQDLTYLGLGQNLYTGELPSELGHLTLLEELDVSGNEGLIGTIPEELGRLSNLAVMNLQGTSIQGAVPQPLCARVKAGTLDLSANCSLVQCCS